MSKSIVFFFLNLIFVVALSQPQTASAIFAHNDYAKPQPFYNAYSLETDYIEVDIFLKQGKLLVGHTRMELNGSKTLDSLYLKPLRTTIIKNNGMPYVSGKKLTLMIDLKTKGDPTLKVLVDKLRQYPELINCKNFVIAVSGNMPDPATWFSYPDFIHFDGRPNITYADDQLSRVVMISDNFRNYSHWDGKGVLTDAEKVLTVIKRSHELGKPVRFWSIPDNAIGWTELNKLLVDILNTDHVAEATTFMKKH